MFYILLLLGIASADPAPKQVELAIKMDARCFTQDGSYDGDIDAEDLNCDSELDHMLSTFRLTPKQLKQIKAWGLHPKSK